MHENFVKVPFDVEIAKRIQSGEIEGKIITADGRNVRIICFDANIVEGCIIALVANSGDDEIILRYNNDGCRIGEPLANLILEIPYTCFNDGDVLYCKTMFFNWIFIYKRQDEDKIFCHVALNDPDNDMYYSKYLSKCDVNYIRYATKEEKQRLINALKENKEPESKEYFKRFFCIDENKECEFKPFDNVLVR